MKIWTFLTRTFTWWNEQTFGTQVWTRLYGEFVGDDEFGNRYFRTKGGKIDPALGFERRWVDLQGLYGCLDHPAGVVRLDAPHGRRAADRGEGRGAAVVEAAPAQHDRHARRATPDRLDAGARPPPEGDRRLQGVDAGAVTQAVIARPAQQAEAIPPDGRGLLRFARNDARHE